MKDIHSVRVWLWGGGLLLALLAPHASAQRMLAIASIFPLTDIVEQVGGDRLQVITLLPAGASPHTYEPTPEQVRHLSRARVFFQVGLGLEFWLDKLVRAAKNPGLRRVDLSRGIETLPTPSADLPGKPTKGPPRENAPQTSRSSQESHREDSHRHEGADAHYWVDPVRMQQVVRTIAGALQELDPEHASAYTERAERVRAALQTLHQEIWQHTQGLQHRRFIALHSAWTYFAPRYNLEQVAVVEPFPGREPSPSYLADLVRLMKRERVSAILVEPQLSAAAAQALARETGAKVGLLDYLGGRGISGRDSYMALMRYNVAQLVKVLQ
ncbi:MAG: zinc ABC transporter substrate-binding protein [Nitrospinae bacterium]|nr:zinc ABC transporter substrate-binding protein [Nitrospinota bacterium]